HPDAPYPAGSSLNHPDHIAAKLAAVAVLAALEHRRRTGEGQLIEMSQAEAAAYLIGEFYLEGPATGRPAAQCGNAALYACPHRAARGAIVTVEHPEIGPERHSGNPLRLSLTPLAPPTAAPRLGADTEDVLIRVLGLSRAQVARLAEDGVLT